jgi:hypothetical protein
VREPFARWHATVYRSMCALVAGDLPRAIALAEEGYRLGAPVSESGARHAYLVQLSGSLRLLGEREQARVLVYEAAARYPSLAGWRCAVGVAEAEAGHVEAARELFCELMAEGLPALQRDAFVLSVLCPLAELCTWVGDAASAEQLYAALLPSAQHCGTIGYGVGTYGPVARYLGLLAAQSRKHALAVQHFAAAAEASARMHSPTYSCLTALSHAAALLPADCPLPLRQAAGRELARARDLSAAHGFGLISRLCGWLTPLAEECGDAHRGPLG